MSPYRAKLQGVNIVKFFLGGMIVYIKCGQRSLSAPFPEIILHPNRPVYVLARQFEGSKDVLALRPAIEGYIARRRQ
jgi:hypothetical protein